jgi:hypothetical protein
MSLLDPSIGEQKDPVPVLKQIQTDTDFSDPEGLVKSRQRVADHGEVFTPSLMVEGMLNLVSDESARIDSRFLEPACGSGNFLCAVLLKKLATVEKRYGSSEFEKRHNALFALMCIYGIELLKDNITECKENLIGIFIDYLELEDTDALISAAKSVLNANIIQGDALTLNDSTMKAIEFPEWGYLGKGKYQRRDFRFDDLTQRAGIEGTLFEMFEEDQLFAAIKTYPQMNIEEIGK